jgi:PAS domain S-box-containing protein
MNQKHQSIRGKLMRLVLVVSAVVVFLTSAGFFVYEFFTYRETSRERLATLAEVIAANSTGALAFADQEDASEILQALVVEKHIVAAAIYDEKGNLFVKYPSDLPGYNLPLHPLKDERFKFKDDHLEGFVPVIQKKQRLGMLFLRSDMEVFYDRLERYAMITFLVVAISIFVAYLLSRQLQKTVSTPILALATTAGNISNNHDYTVRAQKFDNDELGILTDAFNQMLAQIEKQNAEITSFNYALEQKVNERTEELKKANTELKLKSDLEENIINSSIDIIAVLNKNYEYVVLNKYGCEAFGVQKQDIIGKNIIEVFPQLENSQMYETLQRAFKKREVLHMQSYKSKISDRVMENFFIPLFDNNDEVYQVLVVGHDITDINEAHNKLKELNKELEKSNTDLEQFAFVASHDLQEPLRKIQTFSQILEQNLDNKETSKKYLAKIATSAERMTNLIKAVLNYSRLSNEKGLVEMVDLNEIIANIENDYELTIAEKGARIIHDKLPVIFGNPLQLNQLMLNLVGNSLKFSTKQPVITISTSYKTEDLPNVSDNDDFVELTFKDNGIGFDQLYADKIFTVFQRLHNKQEYPGTGIGLALCKKIVDNHNGSISVVSTTGEGTTFTIKLPVNLPKEEKTLVS